MHSDPKRRQASKANKLQILAAIMVAATAITVGVSLGHQTRSEGASQTAALAPSTATPAMAPASREGVGADPSLPAAAEALRGKGGADGDEATTF